MIPAMFHQQCGISQSRYALARVIIAFVLRPAAGNGPPEQTAPYLRRELR